jgi:hypothetical protein
MKEYWLCVVGPVERSDVPDGGGDLPMRIAVSNALEELVPSAGGVVLSSGWGVSEEQRERVMHALYAEHSVQRIGLLARISKWFGAIANR